VAHPRRRARERHLAGDPRDLRILDLGADQVGPFLGIPAIQRRIEIPVIVVRGQNGLR
jgi:hypothetical protein